MIVLRQLSLYKGYKKHSKWKNMFRNLSLSVVFKATMYFTLMAILEVERKYENLQKLCYLKKRSLECCRFFLAGRKSFNFEEKIKHQGSQRCELGLIIFDAALFYQFFCRNNRHRNCSRTYVYGHWSQKSRKVDFALVLSVTNLYNCVTKPGQKRMVKLARLFLDRGFSSHQEVLNQRR